MSRIGDIPKTDRDQFKADLNQASDSDRKMKSITIGAVNKIFEILQVKNPGCDANDDGVVKGDELKCLNYAWKGFLPE